MIKTSRKYIDDNHGVGDLSSLHLGLDDVLQARLPLAFNKRNQDVDNILSEKFRKIKPSTGALAGRADT